MTELSITLVPGQARTGKTTLSLSALAAAAAAGKRVFVFDPLGIMASTCGIEPAETEEELMVAADEGICFFDPTLLFPGQRDAAFAWFSRWSYTWCQEDAECARNRSEAPRRNVLFVDEVWKHCTPQLIPQPLAEWVQDGAKFGCECLFATQTPNKLNSSITGQLTEVISFRLQDKNALEFMSGLGFDIEELRALQPGHYVALNLYSGGVRRGRVF